MIKTPEERYLNEHYYHTIVEYIVVALAKKKIDVTDIRNIVNLAIHKFKELELERIEHEKRFDGDR